MLQRLNPFVAGYFLVYFLNTWFATSVDGFPLEEALGVLVVMGIGFSLIAHFLSRNATPLDEPRPPQANEGWVLLGLVIYFMLVIIPGNKPLTWLIPVSWQDTEAKLSVITLVRKMTTFVVIPFLVYRFLFRFGAADFGLSTDWKKVFSRKHMVIFFGMSFLLAAFNYYAGSGARPLREGLLSGQQLLLGIPILFLWDYLEVGLGEEFFFRGLLQNRLAVLLRSPWGSIFVTSFIFGVVHAPGMYLRGAGVIEGLGGAPSLLTCVSYCIAVQSVTGIFFGILWHRTRNLWILMGIHAITDLVPHLYGFVKEWGI